MSILCSKTWVMSMRAVLGFHKEIRWSKNLSRWNEEGDCVAALVCSLPHVAFALQAESKACRVDWQWITEWLCSIGYNSRTDPWGSQGLHKCCYFIAVCHILREVKYIAHCLMYIASASSIEDVLYEYIYNCTWGPSYIAPSTYNYVHH